jgi:glycosyltransferase involved in cell wall biosynthesis
MMPVYNGSEWLDESIPSVLSQTFRDFEFLIIDDASTDSSFDLMQKYARLDRRIRLFQNSQNIGQGCSLNFAMTKAVGEYFCFIGQDDLYKTTYLEKMLLSIKKYDSDFALCQCFVFKDQSGMLELQDNGNLSSNIELLTSPTYQKKCAMAVTNIPEWLKIIKKDFVSKHNMQFGRNINCDYPFHMQLIWFAKRICFIHEPLYFFRMHPKQASARGADFAHSNFETFKELERFHRKYLPWDDEFFKFIRPLSGLMYRKHKWKVKLEVWKHKLVCKVCSLLRRRERKVS